MKSGYYNPEDTIKNIVRQWIESPSECVTPKEHAWMTACLVSIAAAHESMVMAKEFSDEGNDESISLIIKSIESEINKYSAFVSL